jgi:2-polyprenyl-6-methoxyphenol hydroxylase-like FAD-dependent oxidoreductase
VRIECVGGGPGGLYLAVLLKLGDPGHEVTVYERGKPGSNSGWGVTFRGTLLAQVRDQDPGLADEIEAASVCWRGQVVQVRGQRVKAPSEESYTISRLRLVEILTSRALALGVRVVHDTEVASLGQLHPAADLIVAADGVNSTVRQLSEGFETRRTPAANKYIWLGSDHVFGPLHYFFTETEHGWVWAHAYSIDTETSTFAVECSPQTFTALGFDRMTTGEAVPVIENMFKEHLEGSQLFGELGDGNIARWTNFRTLSNEHWHVRNIVLLGDSAHTTHFSTGKGTTLALQDAACLADQLGRQADVESALKAYELQRKQDLAGDVVEAYWSARWFDSLDRYIGLEPEKFGALLFGRTSPLVAVLPPRFYHLIRPVAQKVQLASRARAAVKGLLSRRRVARTQP